MMIGTHSQPSIHPFIHSSEPKHHSHFAGDNQKHAHGWTHDATENHEVTNLWCSSNTRMQEFIHSSDYLSFFSLCVCDGNQDQASKEQREKWGQWFIRCTQTVRVSESAQSFSFVQHHHQKVLPTQMCAYFNVNMLYHHQRNEIYIFIISLSSSSLLYAVHCALYLTTTNTSIPQWTSSATGSLSRCLPFLSLSFLIRCAFLFSFSSTHDFCCKFSWHILSEHYTAQTHTT